MFKELWAIKVHLVNVVLSIGLVVVLIVLEQTGALGFTTNLLRKPAEHTSISVTVKKTLPVSEINGLAVSVEKVIDTEQGGLPVVGGKKMLIIAGWNVKLGIDASRIRITADESRKTIHVRMPNVKVLSMEQSTTPHVYSQTGSLLDRYSSQDVLDAVDKQSDRIKSEVLKDKDYRAQTVQSVETTLSTIIDGAPGVKSNYKIAFDVQ